MRIFAPEVTVVIPTLNEAEGIKLTIEEIKKVMGNVRIIVIDGGSVDETVQIAAPLGVEVVRQTGVGKGMAIAQALKYVARDTKWLVIIDADYSCPAAFIPYMIKILNHRKDVGMVSSDRARMKPRCFSTHLSGLLTNRRYLERRFLAFIHRLLNGVDMNDPLGGDLRVFNYNCLKDFQPNATGFDIEVEENNYISKIQGLKIVEVPVYHSYRGRVGGRPKFRPVHSLAILRRMIIMALNDIVSTLKSTLTNEGT